MTEGLCSRPSGAGLLRKFKGFRAIGIRRSLKDHDRHVMMPASLLDTRSYAYQPGYRVGSAPTTQTLASPRHNASQSERKGAKSRREKCSPHVHATDVACYEATLLRVAAFLQNPLA
jgi:hypothetical protein